MQTPSADATWEELYDSGQLDQQLAQLNVSGQQPSHQISPHCPQQGLVMRPLLPEHPHQQSLIMPTTHHIAKAPGPHSMAIFGNNPAAFVAPTHVTALNGPPPANNIVQQNGYQINPHISPQTNIVTSHVDMRPPMIQNRIIVAGNGANVQNSHEQQPRPLMSIMAQTHGGYPHVHQIQQNPNNMILQASNQVQNNIQPPKSVPQGPPPPMQNSSVASRTSFQSPPPLRLGAPDGSYQLIPYHGQPGPIVLPQMPMEPRSMGPIPIDMSVPPPRIPMNGNVQTRPHNVYYQNGFGTSAPVNKSHAQKQTKVKNSKNNFTTNSSNTQTQQKTLPIQPVFNVNSASHEQFNAKAAAAAYNSVQVENDYPRTMYRPPEPKVTILKRPVSTPSNLSLQASSSTSGASDNSDEGISSTGGGINNIRTKSLKQREEEYAQARLRILGSTEPETSSGANLGPTDSSSTTTSQSTPNVYLAQQKSSGKNKLTSGNSLTVISGLNLPNEKSNTLNHSNHTISSLSKGLDCSAGLNVGQGSA